MAYDTVLSISGDPLDGTYRVTLGNAPATLAALGIPIVVGSMKAVGALVTIETQDARVLYGTSKSGALGHVMAVGASGEFQGYKAVESLKLGNSASGSNAVAEVTVFF